MNSTLHCYSFHSVKGGVGKSTLSTLTACALAKEHPEARVYLVDMDLTGTSLADVLPLEAPYWNELGPDEPIDLLKSPDGFLARLDSRSRIERRREPRDDPKQVIGVPFLNDYLLFEPKVWDREHDIQPAAIAWRMADGPDNLRVFPSSALPRDLMRALPVIYDEEHAAFLEGRLEYLLAAITLDEKESFVVFDTPPTIPGLSHSILNLAFRLSHETKIPLAEDGFVPYGLEEAFVDWSVRIVATQDMQDIRAAARWLEWVQQQDLPLVRLVINRAWSQQQQREDHFRRALRDPSKNSENSDDEFAALENPNPILSNPIWIEEQGTMQEIFRSESAPQWVERFLDRLTGDNDAALGGM
ncbi:MAG TPA: P-loop NTPase [Polyangium sp.]|nr:P-loop NTPase [Polyangium sp.]